MFSRRARRYLLWIAGCALAGWIVMWMGASGQCGRHRARCGPAPLHNAQPDDAARGGAVIGVMIGLVAALAADDALWKRRR